VEVKLPSSKLALEISGSLAKSVLVSSRLFGRNVTHPRTPSHPPHLRVLCPETLRMINYVVIRPGAFPSTFSAIQWLMNGSERALLAHEVLGCGDRTRREVSG
jgi:hypothetical protein